MRAYGDDITKYMLHVFVSNHCVTSRLIRPDNDAMCVFLKGRSRMFQARFQNFDCGFAL